MGQKAQDPGVRFVTDKWARNSHQDPGVRFVTDTSGPDRATKTREYDLLRIRVGQKGPNNAEVRAFIANLPAEEQAGITPEEAMDRANDRLRDQHARTIPITANLVPHLCLWSTL